MKTEMLIHLAMEQTCPANRPWTGDAPEEEHGHTSCWIIHELIAKIRELDADNKEMAGILMGPYVNVYESQVQQVDQLLATHIGGPENG